MQSEKSKLSFIIPVYKTEHILERCIKSLLDQGLKSWEAIFVLDGPSEDARMIIERKFKNSDIPNSVIEIEHGGACRARNEGAKYAVGEYWVFWDSDCLIEPGTAQLWVDTLDKDQTIDFVYSGYKFLNESGAIPSTPFDPWMLRINNYISTCFPFRAKVFPGWDENLKSLQDWDFWLTIVERGSKGRCFQGYAFATEYPTKGSISAIGCTRENWLSRMDAVRAKHKIEDKKICVSSVRYKHDGIALAKLIGADYRDYPNFKPHRYETLIQVGFSLDSRNVEKHATIFSQENNETVKRKVIFYSSDDVMDLYNSVNFDSISVYSKLLNSFATQCVNDQHAWQMMRRAGFDVNVTPMPLQPQDEIAPAPAAHKFLVDAEARYGDVLIAITRSLPDIPLEVIGPAQRMAGYTGLIHLFSDRTLSNSVRKTLLIGRQVISNIQQPFCGYVDDTKEKEKFICEVVKKIRTICDAGGSYNPNAVEYWKKQCSLDGFMATIRDVPAEATA